VKVRHIARESKLLMAVRRILSVEDAADAEILRQQSAKVGTVDQKINKLVRDMTDTMFEVEGVGIAAIQIGVPLQVMVVRAMRDAEDEETTRTMVLINPTVTQVSPKLEEDFDGCLSVPGYWGLTDRSVFMRVGYQNRFGRWINGRFEGYLARVVQHEIDHLRGILYTDHISDPEKFYEVVEEDEPSVVSSE